MLRFFRTKMSFPPLPPNLFSYPVTLFPFFLTSPKLTYTAKHTLGVSTKKYKKIFSCSWMSKCVCICVEKDLINVIKALFKFKSRLALVM